jgi:hypothetical protein
VNFFGGLAGFQSVDEVVVGDLDMAGAFVRAGMLIEVLVRPGSWGGNRPGSGSGSGAGSGGREQDRGQGAGAGSRTGVRERDQGSGAGSGSVEPYIVSHSINRVLSYLQRITGG